MRPSALISRAAESSALAYLLRSAARFLSAQSQQEAALFKRASKTVTTTSGSQATITVAGLRDIRLSATSVQVARIDRSIASIRLGVNTSVALKRRDLYKIVRVSQGNTAIITFAVVRPNFIQPRGELFISGGDFRFTSSGEGRRLVSTSRSGTLTTTRV